MAEEDDPSPRPDAVESSLMSMKIENGASSDEEVLNTMPVKAFKHDDDSTPPTPNDTSQMMAPDSHSSTASPRKKSNTPDSANGERKNGDVTVKLESGKKPKLSRSASQKLAARPPQLFDHLPDSTADATATFQVMRDCIYGSKYLGASDQEAMGCECGEEWHNGINTACGDDSDCINRLTKIECTDAECSCGSGCQNQRFQLKQYAKVSVIKTEKKGYGLRAETDLNPHDFIFEYIGDVINESTFRKRMIQYDEEGIKHFYFMSLQKNVFVDATKRGNLGRFCNHSCSPNCYVDKWVVGDKLRMGIFTERRIKAGEELVFNYNVDRYGADPQPCYCAEPNCTGFLGGKTQTERATKLSLQVQEALGIEDGDGWDTAVAKRPRKKKAGEDDEEYVDSVEAKPLDESGVTKVMATLMQCKEKWIVVKLLGRILNSQDERVTNRVVKMHGYQILNSTLLTWKEDHNIIVQILDILNIFPRLTRNKISDSKIESTMEELLAIDDERVKTKAGDLLQEWSTLELGYRIPRKKRELNPSTPDRPAHLERRDSERDRKARSQSRSRSPGISRPSSVAAGLRQSGSQRAGFNGPRPPFPRRPFNPLPSGWFAAQANGNTYYYSASGQTTWTRPTQPAVKPPPPPKAVSTSQVLQNIIDSITMEKPKRETPNATTPQPVTEPPQKTEEKQEKWRSYSEEKKKKLYENTLFPHIKYVMDKFKSKLPREDLKRFAKEVGKKLVNSDFKNDRVEDPTKISSKQEKQVKKYVKEYLDKAVHKRRAHDKIKAEKKKLKEATNADGLPKSPEANGEKEEEVNEDVAAHISEVEMEIEEPKSSLPPSPSDDGTSDVTLKRKRDEGTTDSATTPDEGESASNKRVRSLSPVDTPPAPPPPPPPPVTDEMVATAELEAEVALADQTANELSGTDPSLIPLGAETGNLAEMKDGFSLPNGPSDYKDGQSPSQGDEFGASPSGGFDGMKPESLQQLGIQSGG